MISKELLAEAYRQNTQVLGMHVADFSEADLLVRPTENANHAAWHLGHLSVTYGQLINAATPGAVPMMPQEFVDRHTGKGSKLNDGFDSKEVLLKHLNESTELAVKWMQGLSEADLSKQTHESIRGFAPTVGHMVLVLPTHFTMHVGQIQVIRRKLGKPVLF
jgi:hypothetical protein